MFNLNHVLIITTSALWEVLQVFVQQSIWPHEQFFTSAKMSLNCVIYCTPAYSACTTLNVQLEEQS